MKIQLGGGLMLYYIDKLDPEIFEPPCELFIERIQDASPEANSKKYCTRILDHFVANSVKIKYRVESNHVQKIDLSPGDDLIFFKTTDDLEVVPYRVFVCGTKTWRRRTGMWKSDKCSIGYFVRKLFRR
jgi:hypothetical protein